LSTPAPPPSAQGVPAERAYGTLWPRLLAFLLDNTICAIALIVIAGFIPADAYESDAVAVLALVLFTAWFNYFAIAEWRWGKTIGKNALRLEVTAASGAPVTWNAAAIRNLARIIDVLVIGPVLIATSPTRQRLGDRWAHTLVLRTKPAPVAVMPLPAAGRPRAAAGPPPFHAEVAPPSSPPSATALAALPPPPPPVDLSALPPPGPSLRPPSAPRPVPGHGTPIPATAAAAPIPAGAPTPSREEGVGIPAPTWSIRELLLSIPILIGGLILVGVVIALIDPDAESPAALIAGQALFALVLGGIALGFASQTGKLAGGSLFERLGLRRFRPSALWLAAAAYVAYILFVAMVYAPFVQPEQQDITEELGVETSTLAAVLGGILIVVFAPVSEEMFFRGFVYGALRTRLGLWPAAAISAVIFALPHISSADLSIVPPLAIFGLLLAWLYEYTGSLGPPIALHMINNAIAFTVITSG
jgi:membrane protease YdiL (CAAX protease family)/uncharacterized RDD family membrane protein YckC